MAIKKKKAVKVVAKTKTAPVKKSRPVVTKKAPIKKTTKSVPAKKAGSTTKGKPVKALSGIKKSIKPAVKAPAKKAAKKVVKAALKKVTSISSVTKVKKAPAKKTVKAAAVKKIATPAKKTTSTSRPVVTAIKAPAKKAETKNKNTPIAEIKSTVTEISAKPAVTSAEKVVKIGVKTKKQLVAVAPQPVIEVSNYPKHKVKTLLISQPKPESEKNPYYDLANKYNLVETFRQFIKIEGLPVKDFRAQRIDILEHKAVILTSRMAVDHFFRMCNEMRVTVPESMKYFCINEATAYYLQKYIQYRKRKIFFGHQTIQDLVDVIRKNRDEKFLLPAADVQKEQIVDFLDALNIKYTKAVMYRTVSADLTDIKNLNEYDVLVFFTPAGIRSLKHNFPTFVQGNTRIACFGVGTANTLLKHGYRLDIYAPNPKNPSMSGALDSYIKESNKR
jgi:uroporphyrinogen-III synthase